MHTQDKSSRNRLRQPPQHTPSLPYSCISTRLPPVLMLVISYIVDKRLADEEQNQAEQRQRLGHGGADEEVAHELTLHLRLASSGPAQTIGRDTDADARAASARVISTTSSFVQPLTCQGVFTKYVQPCGTAVTPMSCRMGCDGPPRDAAGCAYARSAPSGRGSPC